MFKNNSVDAAILEHSVESTVHCGIFWGHVSLLGRPSRPKVVSIEIFTFYRDLFSRPNRNFSIQTIAVVSVFFDRPRSSLWCFYIIVLVAWAQFEKTGAIGTTRTIIWKLGFIV